jgi:hypothetical protein
VADITSEAFKKLTDELPKLTKRTSEDSCCAWSNIPNAIAITRSGTYVPIHADSIKDEGGIKVIGDGDYSINPDYAKDNLDIGLFGNCTRFISMDSSWKRLKVEHAGYATSQNLRAALVGKGWAKMTLSADKEGGKEARFRIHAEGKVSAPTTSPAKIASVMVEMLGMKPLDIYNMFDKAVTSGNCTFKIKRTEKVATALRVVDAPNFIDHQDSTFGTALEMPQSRTLRTEFTPHETPRSLPGDRWDPAKYVDSVLTEDPQKIFQFSRDNNVANIFDHGAVGALIKSKDVGALTDTYLKDLSGATDKLGRMLFLLIWAPDDYVSSYGADDLQEKEIELKSVFESMGDVTLDLMKRIRDKETGMSTMLTAP